MDRAKFFAAVRPSIFAGVISSSQVSGTEKILDEAQKRGVPLRQLAYILATAFHESAHTMQPVREMGGEKYLRTKKYYPWVGEGLVQITWENNHRKFGATKPGQMMTWPMALKALFDGMLKGMFTGKKLDDYILGDRTDYVGARRIVNGTDKAALIAGYAEKFASALRAAGYVGQAPAPSPVPPVEPKPVPPVTQPPEEPKGFWAWLRSLFS
jgi:putative chitinase